VVHWGDAPGERSAGGGEAWGTNESRKDVGKKPGGQGEHLSAGNRSTKSNRGAWGKLGTEAIFY